MEVLALLIADADAPELEVGAREGVDGVHDGGAPAAEGQDELLERVAVLLAEDDEVGEDVAEVVDQGAAGAAGGEFGEGRVAELEMW